MHIAHASAFAACVTYKTLNARSASDVESNFTKYRIQNPRIFAQRATAVQVHATSPVCSRVLPVCQHRSVRYTLGTPTSAIDQTAPAAAVEATTYY